MKLLLGVFLLALSPLAMAALTVSSSGLINFLVYIIVIGLIFWLLWWLISYVGLPEPFSKIARVVLAVVAVLICINLLLGLAGSPVLSLR